MRIRHLIALLPVLLSISIVLAQDSGICTEQVQAALTLTRSLCSQIGRNEVCYGNQLLEATPAERAPNFSFSSPGDLADLRFIQDLHLSQLIAPDEWGVALLAVQANLPDTLPGQNVLMVLFGDVQIDNQGGEVPVRLMATIQSSANLRSGPGTRFDIVGAGAKGDEVEIEGRSSTSDWFRIRRSDGQAPAWIYGNLISLNGSAGTLPVMDANTAADALFGPMQAFTFQTGITGLRCQGAPQDGILVQTPARMGQIHLRANEVDIRLGSTAFLRAVPGQMMTVDVIEGQGEVEVSGRTVIVPAGTRAEIPLNAQGLADGPPDLTVYTAEDVSRSAAQLAAAGCRNRARRWIICRRVRRLKLLAVQRRSHPQAVVPHCKQWRSRRSVRFQAISR